MKVPHSAVRARTDALEYLRRALDDPAADFHEGQWEAIDALVNHRARLLVVQRTGWGKSMVYFLATRLLRDQAGSAAGGITLLISPLLALMRNQVEAAARIGIRAETINSSNRKDWDTVQSRLDAGEVDVLLISPERLSIPAFRDQVLNRLPARIGMMVVDEAHCISDWGHDFRPDYRRIARILQLIPGSVPVLATTATANDRVVEDVVQQMGPSLRVVRGSLDRKSLRLQVTVLPEKKDRFAWLADVLPTLEGSGIVYVRTVRDAGLVANWLVACGIAAAPYFGAADNRERLEQQLLGNKVKVLVATSALAMGFDKPDLRFVIHFQRPGSVVEYYQQVGRAGRDGRDAFGILLLGEEDGRITESFIRSAFPSEAHIAQVLDRLAAAEDGLRFTDLELQVNLARREIEQVLKALDVLAPSPVTSRNGRWYRTPVPYRPDPAHAEAIMAIRRAEQEELNRYTSGDVCLMAFLRSSLNEPNTAPCGRCSVCTGTNLLPVAPDSLTAARAAAYLAQPLAVEPRKRLPDHNVWNEAWRCEPGRVLCIYGEAGLGMQVQRGKYVDHHFPDSLIDALAAMILKEWRPDPMPEWITCVPSLRHPDLVPSAATRLARRLGMPFIPAIFKLHETEEQKSMQNSVHQWQNLRSAFQVVIPEEYVGKDVFLLDDIVDSRWTFTYLGGVLRFRGSGRVLPVALARSTSWSE